MTHKQSIKSKRPWYANKMTDAVVLNPSYPFRQRASSKDFLCASNLEITSEEVINTSLTGTVELLYLVRKWTYTSASVLHCELEKSNASNFIWDWK